MSPNAAIEVMLVDDSAVARGLMARGLQKHGDIRVIAMAGNGQDALVMLERVRPQVIVLDIEMPTMSGIEALPRILAQSPGVVVIMASALTRRHAAMSLRALELGAADYVPKPDAQSGQDALPKFLDELGAKIKALAHARGRSAPPTTEARAIPLALKLFKCARGCAAGPKRRSS
jgi:two-component system, chemotaxis family, protein-glutamate methylesterase/glutaminase